jgi:hypothetical protein
MHLSKVSAVCIGLGISIPGALLRAEAQEFSDSVTASAELSGLSRSIASTVVKTSTTIDPDTLSLAPRLELDGTMRFYAGASSQIDVVQIDVTNHGFSPATEPQVSVGMWSDAFAGTLYQYWGGTATDAYTINGSEHGYVRVEVWRGVLQECRSYDVSIDLPFENEVLSGTIATQCPLRWTTPIDAQRLGATPDPLVQGKTLEDIVSSRVQGSAKGFCSNCHNKDAGPQPYYKPNNAAGATTLIEPFDEIGDHVGSPNGLSTWAFGGAAANGGYYYSWAEWFISRSDKPEGLKQVFAKWIADGSLR